MINVILGDIESFVNGHPFYFYLVGTVFSYLTLKWESILDNDGPDNWGDIHVRMVLSLISWPVFIFTFGVCIVHLVNRVSKHVKKNKKSTTGFQKPPRWL